MDSVQLGQFFKKASLARLKNSLPEALIIFLASFESLKSALIILLAKEMASSGKAMFSRIVFTKSPLSISLGNKPSKNGLSQLLSSSSDCASTTCFCQKFSCCISKRLGELETLLVSKTLARAVKSLTSLSPIVCPTRVR